MVTNEIVEFCVQNRAGVLTIDFGWSQFLVLINQLKLHVQTFHFQTSVKIYGNSCKEAYCTSLILKPHSQTLWPGNEVSTLTKIITVYSCISRHSM